MRKHLLYKLLLINILGLCWAVCPAQTQTFFNKLYGTDSIGYTFTCIEKIGHNYIVAGGDGGLNITTTQNASILDSVGNVVESIVIDTALGVTSFFGKELFKVDDSTFVYAYNERQDSLSSFFDFKVIKFHLNGEVLWEKKWGTHLNDGLSSMIQTKDDGFLVLGFQRDDNAPIWWNDAYIVK